MNNIGSNRLGTIVSVNISEGKGTAKQPVVSATIGLTGLVGDAHAGNWDRQVSLLAVEEVEAFEAKAGRRVGAGEFAENLTIRGLDLRQVALLDRLRIGGVELEVTRIGKTCHGKTCSIFQEVGDCIMPREGLFARVVTPGQIAPGDTVEWLPRPLRVAVVTLSDRASAGEYEDLSGPRVGSHLRTFFEKTRWHLDVVTHLIPDDAEALNRVLDQSFADGIDAIITTGGTGAGPRDITPDVVSRRLDRTIPGIMEHIRLKYGSTNPHALLSRGVAGVTGSTVVFTVPGSVKAVDEYMCEILKVLDHLVGMMHGLGH